MMSNTRRKSRSCAFAFDIKDSTLISMNFRIQRPGVTHDVHFLLMNCFFFFFSLEEIIFLMHLKDSNAHRVFLSLVVLCNKMQTLRAKK